MKGQTFLLLGLIFILASVLIPRVLNMQDPIYADLMRLLRVPGIICFIIGVLRIRREKKSA
jgi:hypothetical protein